MLSARAALSLALLGSASATVSPIANTLSSGTARHFGFFGVAATPSGVFVAAGDGGLAFQAYGPGNSLTKVTATPQLSSDISTCAALSVSRNGRRAIIGGTDGGNHSVMMSFYDGFSSPSYAGDVSSQSSYVVLSGDGNTALVSGEDYVASIVDVPDVDANVVVGDLSALLPSQFRASWALWPAAAV